MRNSVLCAQCLDTWGQQLLVGTSDGGLLLLAERPQVVIPEFHALQHVAVCPPLAVTHVATCASLDVAVVLGSCLTVHALPSLQQLHTISCPNPLAIAVGGGTHGPSSCLLAVCCLAASKHKLLIFQWDVPTSSFELKREVPLAHAVCSMVWTSSDSLFIGYKTEYVLLHSSAPAPTPLFTTGVAGGAAVAAAMPGASEVILARDDITIFQVKPPSPRPSLPLIMSQDCDGRPSRKFGLTWSDSPLQLACSAPFVLALLPKGIEVACPQLQSTCQMLHVRGALLVAVRGSGQQVHVLCLLQPLVHSPCTTRAFVTREQPVFCVGVAGNSIFRLQPVPIAKQARALAARAQ